LAEIVVTSNERPLIDISNINNSHMAFSPKKNNIFKFFKRSILNINKNIMSPNQYGFNLSRKFVCVRLLKHSPEFHCNYFSLRTVWI